MLAYTVHFRPAILLKWSLLFLIWASSCLPGSGSETLAQNPTDTVSAREQRLRVTATGQREDVQRFLGFEENNLERYISLPYDMVLDVNVEYFFVKLSILLLLLLPLAMVRGEKTPAWLSVASAGLFLLALWLLIPMAYCSQQEIKPAEAPQRLQEQMATAREEGRSFDAFALQLRQPAVATYQHIHPLFSSLSGNRDKVTYPFMILAFALASWLVRRRMRHSARHETIIVQIIMLYGLFWWFFSAGIPWYGILLLPMLLIFSFRGTLGNTPWDTSDRMQWALLAVVIGLSTFSVLSNGSMRFANYSPQQQAELPFLLPVVQYQSGAKLEEYAFDRVYMGYRPGLEELNNNDVELVYRVGTFIPFFIRKNDQRLFSDNFLDQFQRMYQRMPDKIRLAESLHTYGFSYLVINLKLPEVDQTPEKSLTAKFNAFMDFVTDNPNVELVTTDRIIRDATGQPRFALFGSGDIVNPGSMAVLKLGSNEE